MICFHYKMFSHKLSDEMLNLVLDLFCLFILFSIKNEGGKKILAGIGSVWHVSCVGQR